MQSEPRNARISVWALPVPLAATPGIDVSFSSSGYLDVSVHRVPLHALWIQAWIHGVFPCGFPHSDIRGSRDICSSPRLFAAYHVFRRLSVPRHPPCALSCLTCPDNSGCGTRPHILVISFLPSPYSVTAPAGISFLTFLLLLLRISYLFPRFIPQHYTVFSMVTDLGCRYLLQLISIWIFSIRFSRYVPGFRFSNQIPMGLSEPFLPGECSSPIMKSLLIPTGLKWAFPPQRMFILGNEKLTYPNGLKWTRTTDLTLIRRAL